jgi:hypothetical protein
MYKKSIVSFSVVALLSVASILFLNSPTKVQTPPEPSCCKVSPANCPKENNGSGQEGRIWETFSRELYSFSRTSY